jgi:hypothetical protein
VPGYESLRVCKIQNVIYSDTCTVVDKTNSGKNYFVVLSMSVFEGYQFHTARVSMTFTVIFFSYDYSAYVAMCGVYDVLEFVAYVHADVTSFFDGCIHCWHFKAVSRMVIIDG